MNRNLPQWIYPPTSSKIVKKNLKIPEWVSLITLTLNAVVTFLFAWNRVLSPHFMLLFFIVHFIICYFTDFKENNVPAFLHFHHSITGILIYSMLFVVIGYVVTLIIHNFSLESVQVARNVVLFTYVMLIWVILASSSLVGIIFCITLISYWFPFFVQNAVVYEIPIILYLNVIFLAIFGFWGWITHILFLYSALFQKEDYRHKNHHYHNWAKVISLESIILSSFGLIFQKDIFLLFSKIISP